MWRVNIDRAAYFVILFSVLNWKFCQKTKKAISVLRGFRLRVGEALHTVETTEKSISNFTPVLAMRAYGGDQFQDQDMERMVIFLILSIFEGRRKNNSCALLHSKSVQSGLKIDECGWLIGFMMYWGNCTQMVRYAVLHLCCHYECQQVITNRRRY